MRATKAATMASGEPSKSTRPSGPAERIRIKRVYATPAKSDGRRILVDRLWPRGMSKERARLSEWMKEIAPSAELRKWFGHDPARWPEFQRRFTAELEGHADDLGRLRDLAQKGRLTLVYAARDEAHNNAVVLREILLGRK